MTKNRLENFSDGVMSIVITLLAFELSKPIGGADARLAYDFLLSMTPQFLLFILSFITLAIMWMNHHFIISHVEEVKPKLLWINAILLMFITLVPFATRFLSSNPTNVISIMFFALLMFIISFCFSRLFKTIGHIHYTSFFAFGRRIKHIGIYSYLFAFLVTPFNPILGYIFICLPPIAYFLPKE